MNKACSFDMADLIAVFFCLYLATLTEALSCLR